MAIRGILDALYGQVRFDDDLAALISTPIVQRLRHVRLSNIDSLNMPGIANLSRFEHVLGVAHLATTMEVAKRLPHLERTALTAAAALHDWAITAFGHLVEEAYQYAGSEFDHEERFSEIVRNEGEEELGGANLQILHGRQAGLLGWAKRVAGSEADALIHIIADNIRGKGKYGKIISADIDIDNIDNVFRVAYHSGLNIDRELPLRLAKAIVDVDRINGAPVFKKEAMSDLETWVSTRSNVYSLLMPAEYDFAGKIMVLSAAVGAVRHAPQSLHWSMTDYEFITRMLASRERRVSDTIERWLSGELWEVCPLYWFEGNRPNFPALLAFSDAVSEKLERPCFAYGIKDKRNRKLNVFLDDGAQLSIGEDSKKWLFGMGSVKRFTAKEVNEIIEMAQAFFQGSCLGRHEQTPEKDDGSQLCLL